MTIEQTRQLGIEFERRLHTMMPQTEFTDKLDTQTIYSYLNQYQDQYVREIFLSIDRIDSGNNISSRLETTLQSLLREQEMQITDAIEDNTKDISTGDVVVSTGRSVTFKLSPDIYMYVRSVSKVSSTFNFKSNKTHNLLPIRIIPNEQVGQANVWKLIETPYNTLRILRRPAAVFTPYATLKDYQGPTLTVIYDQYTTPEAVKVTYYKQPDHFDIMTSTPCELPIDCFETLVSGAVDLYTQYVAGAEARRRLQQDEQRRRQEQAERQRSNRNNNSYDEE